MLCDGKNRKRNLASRVGARGFIIELALDPREQIFGFGLQMKSHNRRGLKKTVRRAHRGFPAERSRVIAWEKNVNGGQG